MTIKVLIADDHDVVRQGISSFLALDSGLEMVGEAANGHEAVKLAQELKPDVVLLDLLMPEMDGLTALHELRNKVPETQVVVLTSVLEADSINRAMSAGASGYLLKNMRAEELCNAVRAASSGQVLFSQQAARLILSRKEKETPLPATMTPSKAEGLTERETVVLRLLAQGKANKEIAQVLNLSEKTIKFHVSIILAKLGLQSRTQAAAYAAQLGMVSFDMQV